VLVKNLAAQKQYQDLIYLKNGEIVKGVLINEILKSAVTIVSLNGDTLTFQQSDILKLTRENEHQKSESSKCQWLKRGYELTIEAGKALATGDFGISYFQADVINGVRLNSFIASGFGIGLTRINDPGYDYYLKPKIIVPVYFDLRINYPSAKKFSPYISFDFGGSISKDKNYSDNSSSAIFRGFLFKSSIGTHICISPDITFNLSFGFRSQQMPFTHILYPGRNADGAHTDIHFSNSINILAGFTF